MNYKEDLDNTQIDKELTYIRDYYKGLKPKYLIIYERECFFKENSEVNEIFKGMPDIPQEYQAKLKIINKKPILASSKELSENSRSHSAKLRIGERI